MKSLLTVLLFSTIVWNCAAQNPCLVCRSTQNHRITGTKAVNMIMEANRRFPSIMNYGGTIYGDLNYFNRGVPVLPAKTYRTFKFHFCASTDNATPDSFYLVFQNDLCKDNQTVVNPTPPFYYQSSDFRFSKMADYPSGIPGTRDDHLRRDGYQRTVPHSETLAQRQQRQAYSGTLATNKNYFARKTDFTNELQTCNNYTGYFIYNNSIAEIFANKDAAADPCAGIRYYIARDPVYKSKIRVILVGVDQYGNNLKTWRENSVPCDSVNAIAPFIPANFLIASIVLALVLIISIRFFFWKRKVSVKH